MIIFKMNGSDNESINDHIEDYLNLGNPISGSSVKQFRWK